MTLGIRKTGFHRLALEFPDLICEIRNKDTGSLPAATKKRTIISKVIVLQEDFSKLHCTEIIDNATEEIEEYWYDWHRANGEVIMKFHGHFHPPGTPESITRFDPFHIHKRANALDQGASARELNERYRTLHDVLFFIKNAMYAKQYL